MLQVSPVTRPRRSLEDQWRAMLVLRCHLSPVELQQVVRVIRGPQGGVPRGDTGDPRQATPISREMRITGGNGMQGQSPEACSR